MKESVEYLLGSIDSKLDGISARLDDHVEAIKSIGERTTKIETKVNRWAGGVAVLAGIVAVTAKEAVSKLWPA